MAVRLPTSPDATGVGRAGVRRRRLGRQPALDGLRGVAVTAVMVFHGGFTWMPGGFLGVDLFFVLSGFLITTLLLEEWGATGTIRLGQFWGRRARRLLPALALVLAAVAVYGATWAPAVTRPGLRWDGLASLFYVANWRFVLGHQPYFASFAAPSPLRHLWSLAVEEQWYLLWPPALVALLAVVRRRLAPLRKLDLLLVVLGVAALASAGEMLGLDLVTNGAADAGRSYYGTDTHAQVILVGAFLAVARLRWPPEGRRSRRAVRRAGLVGAGVCAAMILLVSGSDRWLYRGGFLVFALAGAAVVAASVLPGGSRISDALSVAPLRAVGRVSYGLYLWHWPVDVALNPSRVHLGVWSLFVVRTAVAAAISVASYHLVELPIRTGRVTLHRPLRTVAVVAGVLAALLVVLPSLGTAASSAQSPVAVPVEVARDATVASSTGTAPARQPAAVGHGRRTFTLPAVPPGQPVRVLVVGDSVGQSLTRYVVPPPQLRFANASIEGCGLTFGAAIVNGYPIYDVSQCPQAGQDRAWLAGLATHPDVVVMSFGTWEVFDQEYLGRAYRVYTAAYRELLLHQLQADLELIVAHAPTARIALLDVPCYQETTYDLGGAGSPRNDPSRVAWVNSVFGAFAAANPGRVTMIPISQWVCPGGHFLTQRNGVILRPDGVHYDPQSAALTWAWLGPRVEALARSRTVVAGRAEA
ncbi:MAG: acyltransferase family protein [Acidimicrobiales bacterium]